MGPSGLTSPNPSFPLSCVVLLISRDLERLVVHLGDHAILEVFCDVGCGICFLVLMLCCLVVWLMSVLFCFAFSVAELLFLEGGGG